ncbi:MAG: hypothetical protein A3E37_01490 [Candidatus Andersenbacteria bacterium RIFCSPHIGHO2_12_FULL_46_9]|nr:MAG: hypothetical protein UW94_C0020G0017 [Parcubacteria group bacterium GW2011_GWA2_45_14]OGY35808.1 MAG: hypothetical protein A3E37_01490 [Candidatus Andersenbacteria bacterium RIFCSPHIGHO2_12_FULL_46_9]OGY35951.1 MAG: hypothetical protein A3B76_04220 [Candidatus Andersenbacteria bacterium RIFCSPHIGHO2_02_FULL_46_16]OGY39001.1 MAG: hypothetical protein A3G57_03760 [Candidatus Andersenbacteria bacterium RIFCSPLOWO2_12_FULL_45_8]
MSQEPSTSSTKPQSPTTGKIKPHRRRRGGILNFLLFVGIIGAVALFFWAEQQRRDALSKLEQTEQQLQEIKESTERSGQQVADEVLGKVRQHINLPEELQPTVATIIDVDRLRETSDFYKEAKNGDHLILTETRAILYNPDTDRIVDVVPVMLNPEDAAAPADDTEGDTTGAGTDTGTNTGANTTGGGTGQQATPAAATASPDAQNAPANP